MSKRAWEYKKNRRRGSDPFFRSRYPRDPPQNPLVAQLVRLAAQQGIQTENPEELRSVAMFLESAVASLEQDKEGIELAIAKGELLQGLDRDRSIFLYANSADVSSAKEYARTVDASIADDSSGYTSVNTLIRRNTRGIENLLGFGTVQGLRGRLENVEGGVIIWRYSNRFAETYIPESSRENALSLIDATVLDQVVQPLIFNSSYRDNAREVIESVKHIPPRYRTAQVLQAHYRGKLILATAPPSKRRSVGRVLNDFSSAIKDYVTFLQTNPDYDGHMLAHDMVMAEELVETVKKHRDHDRFKGKLNEFRQYDPRPKDRSLLSRFIPFYHR